MFAIDAWERAGLILIIWLGIVGFWLDPPLHLFVSIIGVNDTTKS